MNIHPLLVHFPIAFFTVYAVMELVRMKKVIQRQEWFYIKAVVLLIGFLGSLAALMTGDIAKDAIGNLGNRQLISLHEFFAELTIFIFGTLAGSYVVAGLRRFDISGITQKDGVTRGIWAVLVYIEELILHTPLVILFALLGLAAVTITGGLGGSIVYGPNNDFATSLIYHFFFH
jgi:uncharacterized membrane protein